MSWADIYRFSRLRAVNATGERAYAMFLTSIYECYQRQPDGLYLSLGHTRSLKEAEEWLTGRGEIKFYLL